MRCVVSRARRLSARTTEPRQGKQSTRLSRIYYRPDAQLDSDGFVVDSQDNFYSIMGVTLMDPTKRAVYDDLSGFSTDGINPFRETGAVGSKAFVDEYSCIGCRNCTCVAPNTFEIEEEYGRARAVAQDADAEALVQEAIDTCPVNCIHWVSDRQLPWLQRAMSSMPRAGVWALLSGSGGGNIDVFSEAEKSWERRRAELEIAIEADKWGAYWAANGQVAWNFWGGSASSKQAKQQEEESRRRRQQEQQAASQGGSNSRISQLAARAAAASRRWRASQAAKPKQELYINF